jgi:uncharacterized protein YciI
MPLAAFADQPIWLVVLSLRPGLEDRSRWTDAERAAVTAHFERLQAQEREGRLVIAGRSNDLDAENRLAADTIGIVVFHAPDRDEAEALTEADPAVENGVMRYKLRSFNVAVARSGLA